MCSIIQNRIILGGIILFNHCFIKENSLEIAIEKICPQMSEVRGWFECWLSGFRALHFLLVSLLFFVSADCPIFSFTLNCNICYLSEDIRGLAFIFSQCYFPRTFPEVLCEITSTPSTTSLPKTDLCMYMYNTYIHSRGPS